MSNRDLLSYKLYDHIHRKLFRQKQKLVSSDQVIDYLLVMQDEEFLDLLNLTPKIRNE